MGRSGSGLGSGVGVYIVPCVYRGGKEKRCDAMRCDTIQDTQFPQKHKRAQGIYTLLYSSIPHPTSLPFPSSFCILSLSSPLTSPPTFPFPSIPLLT